MAWVSLGALWQLTAAPFIWMEVMPVKPVPVRVTRVPAVARTGEKLVITGADPTVNRDPVAVPAGVVTVTFPEVAPLGTAVVIWVSLVTV